MTLEDRARLAVHDLRAGPPGPDGQTDYVLNMLRLAVADEREACAKIADAHRKEHEKYKADPDGWNVGNEHAGETIAEAIRARS